MRASRYGWALKFGAGIFEQCGLAPLDVVVPAMGFVAVMRLAGRLAPHAAVHGDLGFAPKSVDVCSGNRECGEDLHGISRTG
jgi:hypothetical protein